MLAGARTSLDVVAVAERRDQQQQAGLVGQLGHPGGECLLEALGERQRPGIGVLGSRRAAATGSSISASGLPAASSQDPVRAPPRSAVCADASSSSAAAVGSRRAEPVLGQPGVGEQRRS